VPGGPGIPRRVVLSLRPRADVAHAIPVARRADAERCAGGRRPPPGRAAVAEADRPRPAPPDPLRPGPAPPLRPHAAGRRGEALTGCYILLRMGDAWLPPPSTP